LLTISPFPFIACGQLIGTAMATRVTWRWVFYLNIVLSGIALVLTLLFYRPVSDLTYTNEI
jgi:MFS family permease